MSNLRSKFELATTWANEYITNSPSAKTEREEDRNKMLLNQPEAASVKISIIYKRKWEGIASDDQDEIIQETKEEASPLINEEYVVRS